MSEFHESGEIQNRRVVAINFADKEMLEQAYHQLLEYTELEEMYRGEHPQLQVGLHGPIRLVGIFKTAIMEFAIAQAEQHGYHQPIVLHDVLEYCRDKTTFSIVGAEDVSYIPNPHLADNHKKRLPYCPDFSQIDEIEDVEQYAEVKAFYESFYTVQKFTQGIRDDMIGGSEFVDPPNTWESIKQQLDSSQDVHGRIAINDANIDPKD